MKEFLPAQLSEEEVAREVQEAITGLGAKDLKDMGKVMKVPDGKIQVPGRWEGAE